MTKSCLNCGTMNVDDARFCTSCGGNVQNTSKAMASNLGTSQPSNPCLWCHQNQGFTEEEGKLDSKWGMTAHKVKMFICNNCGYVHLFGLGRSIWDFD